MLSLNPSYHNNLTGRSIRVRGVVQGVGFRPFVASLARDYGVIGTVWNDAEGVMIHAWAEDEQFNSFKAMLQRSPPPLAHIEAIEEEELTQACQHKGFKIIASNTGKTYTSVAADAATCSDCKAEISDPENRRYRYPFTNCTHCGPRLSIIREVPYDRGTTSMSDFTMCPKCQAEYDDQNDRRYHAQPNACSECGPELWLENTRGERVILENGDDAIATAGQWIRSGKIIAIKGLGGFHLACNARDETAVNRLRQSKKRDHKPFALMAKDIAQIKRFAMVSRQEQTLLESVAAPVVILNVPNLNSISDHVAENIAPGQDTLGFMLPYTPLHHLLLAELDGPIVLTSGNINDEPQCIDNEQARQRLNTLVNAYLFHNRDIINRLDDSVVRVMAGKSRVLRRARGYAPISLKLPSGFEQAPAILAMGAELKNTFCMLNQDHAIVSQYMGDLEHPKVFDDYRHSLDLYRKLYDFDPEIIAIDLHSNYLSSQWGNKIAVEEQCSVNEIQHHHAHMAACMIEHGLAINKQVLGIALDGLGMGENGQLWGGEFIAATYSSFKRLAAIQSVAMIGGTKAMYEPWRNTYAQLHAIGWDEIYEQFADLDMIDVLAKKQLKNMDVMIDKGLNSPIASSMGRLFDAVAAALGICTESISFEGQAAISLERIAAPVFSSEQQAAYPVEVQDVDGIKTLLWKPMWLALLQDLQLGITVEKIAARFHHGVINAISEMGFNLAKENKLDHIVLSGGTFQNLLLLEGVSRHLSQAGMEVLIPSQFPANDGGLSLGQAIISSAQFLHKDNG